jgi:hypothetical protein
MLRAAVIYRWFYYLSSTLQRQFFITLKIRNTETSHMVLENGGVLRFWHNMLIGDFGVGFHNLALMQFYDSGFSRKVECSNRKGDIVFIHKNQLLEYYKRNQK